MPAPVITFTDASSGNLASLSFGNVDAGSTTTPVTLLVWNNKGGGTIVSDTASTTMTTKTFTGLDVGDSPANGQEVVTSTMLGVKCTSAGDSAFAQVGGSSITHSIGTAAGGAGVIKGVVGGDAAVCVLQLVVPSNVTPGAAQWLGRISYLYS